MSWVRFAMALIFLAGSGAALTAAIIESCTSAQAQAQTASDTPVLWDHNGSTMYLVAKGQMREFYYQKPRAGMLDAGARPGSLLFRGQIDSGQLVGTAYLFNPRCGPIPFEVKGAVLGDEQIVLSGEAPRVGRECRVQGSHTTNLEFRRLKPNETAQSQEASRPEQAPLVGEPKTLASNSAAAAGPAAGQPPPKSEPPPAAKEAFAKPVDSKAPAISTTRADVTKEIPSGKFQEKYLWGAAFVVMIVWLLIFSFGKILLRL